MPRLTKVSFEHDEDRYILDIDFDDAEVMGDRLVFTLTARREPSEERRDVEVGLILDFKAEEGVVLFPDGQEVKINLGDLPLSADWNAEEESLGPEAPGAPTPTDGLHEALSAEAGETFLSAFDHIPLGDPLLCLVKAGLSSVIGQALICRETRGRTIRDVLPCLREHAGSISGRTLFRAVRCVVFV